MLRKNPAQGISEDDGYGGLPQELRQGEVSPWMQKYLRVGIIAALVAVLGVAAFSIISFIGAPFVLTVLINAWFAGSAIYLAGLSYGIVNDLIGCRKNLPYFSLGHQWDQKSLIPSNDPNAVGIAWGIFATADLAIPAGILFSVATLITGFIGLPFAAFALPLIAAIIPIALLGAHLYSRKKEKEREQTGELGKLFLNGYQSDRLNHWLKSEKDINSWLGNSDRNMVGFIAMPIIGVVGLVSLITLSSIPSLLPAVVFSAAFSVFPPVGLGILLAVGILAACAYLYVNHNKQVNNGYKLDFPDSKSTHGSSSTYRRVIEVIENEPSPPTSPKKKPTMPAPANEAKLDGEAQQNNVTSIKPNPSQTSSNGRVDEEPSSSTHDYVLPITSNSSSEILSLSRHLAMCLPSAGKSGSSR